jgi:hypothetical protein
MNLICARGDYRRKKLLLGKMQLQEGKIAFWKALKILSKSTRKVQEGKIAFWEDPFSGQATPGTAFQGALTVSCF